VLDELRPRQAPETAGVAEIAVGIAGKESDSGDRARHPPAEVQRPKKAMAL
jgi:hypothetical protein